MLSSCLILICSLIVAGGNLLSNPGFEIESGGKPSDWALYVMPKPGAEGALDDKVFAEGSRSIALRNSDEYPSDPLNNWSQNIVKELAEETLVVGGLIKTEGAGGADIWLQCWRKAPWGVLYVARTGDTHALSGDTDWTPVAMKVAVPKETDFVTVRCVLKGKGVAWFDDVRVLCVASAGNVDSEVKKMSEDLAKGKPDAVSAEELRKDVVRETESLTEAVRSLKDTNESLRKELNQVREELKDMRHSLEQKTKKGAPVPSSPRMAQDRGKPAPAPAAARETTLRPQSAPKPGVRVPPLVPRGYDWKELSDER